MGNKKVLQNIFGRYRIAGLVDRCKAAAEKLGYHVFGVGVRVINLLLVIMSANLSSIKHSPVTDFKTKSQSD